MLDITVLNNSRKQEIQTKSLKAKDILRADEFHGSPDSISIDGFIQNRHWGLTVKIPLQRPQYIDNKIVLEGVTDSKEMDYINISFSISDLDRKTEFNQADLYGPEDFVVLDKNHQGWRDPVIVKLGNFFADYRPNGKGSFKGNVYFIDKKGQDLILLLNVKNDRYPTIDLASVLPFSIATFNPGHTGWPSTYVKENTQKNSIERTIVNLREIFIGLALGKKISDFPDINLEINKINELMREQSPSFVTKSNIHNNILNYLLSKGVFSAEKKSNSKQDINYPEQPNFNPI